LTGLEPPWLLIKNIATILTGIEPSRLFDRKRATMTFPGIAPLMAIKRNRASMAL
jgi:hypothetical protein